MGTRCYGEVLRNIVHDLLAYLILQLVFVFLFCLFWVFFFLICRKFKCFATIFYGQRFVLSI